MCMGTWCTCYIDGEGFCLDLVSLIGPWQGGHVNVPSYGILIINTSVLLWFLEYMVLLHMFESHNDMFHTNASHSCITV